MRSSVLHIYLLQLKIMLTLPNEGIFNDGSDIIRSGLNCSTGCLNNKCDHGVKVINMSFIENYNLSNDYIFCTKCTEKLALQIILYKTKATISFITKGSVIVEKNNVMSKVLIYFLLAVSIK
jgi:hypothetical protein